MTLRVDCMHLVCMRGILGTRVPLISKKLLNWVIDTFHTAASTSSNAFASLNISVIIHDFRRLNPSPKGRRLG